MGIFGRCNAPHLSRSGVCGQPVIGCCDRCEGLRCSSHLHEGAVSGSILCGPCSAAMRQEARELVNLTLQVKANA